MNNYPKVFATICKIVDLSDAEIWLSWSNIWKKSISELLEFVINDSNLSDQQMAKLEELFASILSSDTAKSDILQLLESILDKSQLKLATDKFAYFISINLDDFYGSLKSKMTLDQKQVLNSLVETINNV